MKVKVIEQHEGEGKFPKFPKGTTVQLGKPCTQYIHWYACIIDTYATYIPESYMEGNKLSRDYDPTELIQKPGDILEVKEIVGYWLYAVNADNQYGWIPAKKVISLA